MLRRHDVNLRFRVIRQLRAAAMAWITIGKRDTRRVGYKYRLTLQRSSSRFDTRASCRRPRKIGTVSRLGPITPTTEVRPFRTVWEPAISGKIRDRHTNTITRLTQTPALK